MMAGGAGALLVGIAFHLAWIGKRAEAKGRSALAWVGIALALSVAGIKIGVGLFDRIDASTSEMAGFFYATSPLTLGLAPLLIVVLILMALPVRIGGGTSWPVFHARDGAGMLVIERDAVELRWAARTDRIARASLTATADQESLRLAWPDHDVLLMPGGKPANREGRMRQAETMAARLSNHR